MSINPETINTMADVKKNLTEDQIVRAVRAYLKNREYHKTHNAKVRDLYNKAVAAGIK